MPTGIREGSPRMALNQAWECTPRCPGEGHSGPSGLGTAGRARSRGRQLPRAGANRRDGETPGSESRAESGRELRTAVLLDPKGASDGVLGGGAGATGTRTQSSPPTQSAKEPVEGPGRCRFSTVLRDLPGQPFLLGFERRPSVIYQFGLNPNYCCLQVSKFSLLKKKEKEKERLSLSFPKQSRPFGA